MQLSFQRGLICHHPLPEDSPGKPLRVMRGLRKVQELHCHPRKRLPLEWKCTQLLFTLCKKKKKVSELHLSGFPQCKHLRPCVCVWQATCLFVMLGEWDQCPWARCMNSHWHAALCLRSVGSRHARLNRCCFRGGSARAADNVTSCCPVLQQMLSDLRIWIENARRESFTRHSWTKISKFPLWD